MPNKTKEEIIGDLWKSKFIDELVWTITSGNQLKDDLKAELFLILLEMDSSRIIRAYKNNYLNYLCVNIIKKQYHSNTSPFHKTYRKEGANDLPMPQMEWSDYNQEDDIIIEKIMWFVDNKLDLVDRELFKIYYKFGRYDRWLGDLRDKSCQKPISSLRKVEKKLAITTLDGKNITIGYDTIRISLNRSIMRIKHYLENGDDSDT